MIAANSKVPDAEHSDLVSFTQSFVSLSSNEVTHLESETSADVEVVRLLNPVTELRSELNESSTRSFLESTIKENV